MADPMVSFEGHLDKFKKKLADVAKHSDFTSKGLADLAEHTRLVNKWLGHATDRLAEMTKKDRSAAESTLKLVASMEKLHDAAIKENAIRDKKIESQRRQLDQTEAVRRNNQILIDQKKKEAVASKILADQHKAIIENNKRTVDAEKKATAVKRKAIEASKKHSVKIRIMIERMKEAGVDTRKFAQENHKLIKASKNCALAQDKLNRAVARANSTVKRGLFGFRNLRNATDGAGMSFSVLRSKLLLFNFAMAMGVRQIAKFSQEAAKVESMKTAFNTLSGSTGKAATVMMQLDRAVGGTMSQFDLLQQANNALLLGVADNSHQMAEMFEIAKRLGQAMGRDVKTSVESLITGIGRQSVKWLDNIGLIVRVGQANKAYAEQLGTTVGKLTDVQKRQAFLNATLEAARRKALGLPPVVETASDVFASFGSAVDNAGKNIGEGLLPATILVTKAMTGMMNAVTPGRVKRTTAVLTAMGFAFLALRISAMKATTEITLFSRAILASRAALAKSGYGALVVLLGSIAFVLMELTDAWDNVGESAEDVNVLFSKQKDITDLVRQNTERLTKAQDELTKAQDSSVDSLLKQLALLKAKDETEKMLINLGHEASELERAIIDTIIAKIELTESEIALLKSKEDAIKMVNRMRQEGIKAEMQEIKDRRSELDAAIKEEEDRNQRRIELNNKFRDSLKLDPPDPIHFNLAPLTEALDVELGIISENEQRITEFKRKAMLERFDLVSNGVMSQLEAREHYNERVKAFMEMETDELATMADLYSETYSAIADIVIANQNRIIQGHKQQIREEISDLKKTRAYKMADADKQKTMENDIKDEHKKAVKDAFMVQQAAQIGQVWMNIYLAMAKQFTDFNFIKALAKQPILLGIGMAQSAAIAAQKPPSLEQGGLIGGRRHSQGGTMIEAEQGEFIMSRSAVQSVGLENLNRMNEGGGSSSVTVNVSGNVLSQDFVEGELAENIKEAIRRGTDFGIS